MFFVSASENLNTYTITPTLYSLYTSLSSKATFQGSNFTNGIITNFYRIQTLGDKAYAKYYSDQVLLYTSYEEDIEGRSEVTFTTKYRNFPQEFVALSTEIPRGYEYTLLEGLNYVYTGYGSNKNTIMGNPFKLIGANSYIYSSDVVSFNSNVTMNVDSTKNKAVIALVADYAYAKILCSQHQKLWWDDDNQLWSETVEAYVFINVSTKVIYLE